MAAGREILGDIKRFLDRHTSFAVETTLAGPGTLQTMRKAKLRGFQVDLIYICLNTPESGIIRVLERVGEAVTMFPMRMSAGDTAAVWRLCQKRFA